MAPSQPAEAGVSDVASRLTFSVSRSDNRFLRAVAARRNQPAEELAASLIAAKVDSLLHDPDYVRRGREQAEWDLVRLHSLSEMGSRADPEDRAASSSYIDQALVLLDDLALQDEPQGWGDSLTVTLDPDTARGLKIVSRIDRRAPEPWTADALASEVNRLKNDVEFLQGLSEDGTGKSAHPSPELT